MTRSSKLNTNQESRDRRRLHNCSIGRAGVSAAEMYTKETSGLDGALAEGQNKANSDAQDDD